jgi:Protein of unknown function (DUF4240)
MDRAEFWAMVEAVRPPGAGDCAEHAAHLVAALAELPAAEILTYQHIQDQLMAESYHWDLWGAAYLLNFGCSDDGFDYFRGWLLTQGRAIWEAALQDSDGLAELPQVRKLAPSGAGRAGSGATTSWAWPMRPASGAPASRSPPRPSATSSVLRLDHPRGLLAASRGTPRTISSCAGAGRGCSPGINQAPCPNLSSRQPHQDGEAAPAGRRRGHHGQRIAYARRGRPWRISSANRRCTSRPWGDSRQAVAASTSRRTMCGWSMANC